MPSPIDILLDPVSLSAIAIYLGLIAWEFLFPARQLPRVKFWYGMGVLAFVIYFLLSSYLPLLTDQYLARWQLLDLSALPTWIQFTVGFFVYESFLYVWHRSLHAFTPLWRIFHQMHHSAERLDTFGAFWLSPLDTIGFTVLFSVALVLVLGINPQAATAVILTTFFFAIFQHGNFRTPRWLGYLIQRPESHSYHHAKGIHKHNYADVPLFDLLLGTFNNPEHHLETGFYHGASYRVVDMLLWRDLNKNPLKPSLQSESKQAAQGAHIV